MLQFRPTLKFISIVSLLLFTSCLLKSESPIESSSDYFNKIQSGDIIVTNSGNDSILLMDGDGNYKEILASEQTSSLLIYNGLAYDSINKRILFTYDHSTASLDAVKSISLVDGSISKVISNSNLSGALPGLAVLLDGSIVVLEGTTAAEKFLADGTRSGNPFISGLTTTVSDITKLSNGGFVICSTGVANTVRTYNSAGTVQYTATSASPLPTLGAMGASSCTEDSDGNIIVAYNGTTDSVRKYNSTLSTVLWTYTDANSLSNPGKLAVKANGNVFITDLTNHHIVEISSTGSLVRIIGLSLLNIPNNIVVVP